MTSDRAVMKIDIEGHEMKALSQKTARKFMEAINIPVILMEFSLKKQYNDTVKRHEIENWLNFLYSLNKTAHDPSNGELLEDEWQNWSLEVIFVKKYDVTLDV